MHPDVEALADRLHKAVAILERHKVEHWAYWLRGDEAKIRALDFYGIEHLLSAFGGMGSINDLGLVVPHPENPSMLATSPEDETFQALLDEIHRLAVKLGREER